VQACRPERRGGQAGRGEEHLLELVRPLLGVLRRVGRADRRVDGVRRKHDAAHRHHRHACAPQGAQGQRRARAPPAAGAPARRSGARGRARRRAGSQQRRAAPRQALWPGTDWQRRRSLPGRHDHSASELAALARRARTGDAQAVGHHARGHRLLERSADAGGRAHVRARDQRDVDLHARAGRAGRGGRRQGRGLAGARGAWSGAGRPRRAPPWHASAHAARRACPRARARGSGQRLCGRIRFDRGNRHTLTHMRNACRP